jgi:flagellar hook assembly protein FlgD
VSSLEEGRVRQAGVHRVTWDGTNRTGEGVASGVYFYRLRAGMEIRTSRLVVLK